MGSWSTTYESFRNLASRLVKNELSRGIMNTKTGTPKPENNKRNTGGKYFKNASNKKRGTRTVYEATTTTNATPVPRSNNTSQSQQCLRCFKPHPREHYF